MSTYKRGDNTRQNVSDLHALGCSIPYIAEGAGISARHTKRVLVDLGLVSPGRKNPPVSASTLERMRAMVEDGCSFREIARTLGVRWETVARHFPGRQWTHAQAGDHGRLMRRASMR